jgi:hypothetical protein
MSCEASALAGLHAKDEIKTSKALLVGNYVHSYFESQEAHEEFLEENKEHLYKRNGDFYKDYTDADKMIEKLENEPLFNYLWTGEPEVIVTQNYLGVDWKARIDLLNLEKGYFVDLKTTADLSKRFWNDKYGTYVSFVEEYGYVLQIALYEKLLELEYGKPFKGYIYAITKQDPPDIAAIKPESHKLEFELEELAKNIERVEKVKNGEEKPRSCGKCEYCRMHKQLNDFISTDDLLER